MLPQDKCTGCEACVNICNKNAIQMQPDCNGFLYPTIDVEKCIHCGVCEKRCPVINVQNTSHEVAFYAARYTEVETLKRVSSGGIASFLYEKCLDDSWVVYGVVWDKDYSGAHYERATTKDGIKAFAGTKYVQAKKDNIYESVLNDLTTDRKVLFIGLPCEVGGLLSYLGRNYDNLVTVQLVCHGVTSGKYLDEYCRYLENKFKSKIIYFTLRDKMGGVDPKYVKAVFENGKVFSEQLLVSDFGKVFVSCDRESCYNCVFKGNGRKGDVTIGDYWGLPSDHELWNVMGTSLVVSHTLKGDNLIRSIKSGYFQIVKGPENEAKIGNPKMYKSITKEKNRSNIMENVLKYGLHDGVKKSRQFIDCLKILYYRLLPNCVKKIVMKIIK